jgi:hypothetical protein
MICSQDGLFQHSGSRLLAGWLLVAPVFPLLKSAVVFLISVNWLLYNYALIEGQPDVVLYHSLNWSRLF